MSFLFINGCLDYISENRGLIYKVLAEYSVTESTSTIAHHLLSKLSLNSSFTVDKRYSGKPDQIEKQKCGCGCCEVLKGNYGETGYGKYCMNLVVRKPVFRVSDQV